MNANITVQTYRPEFQEHFRKLNLQWIETYFKVEEKDLHQLNNPAECIETGGEIFFLQQQEGKIVGTCAVYKIEDGVYEIAKMAVQENSRGQGLGSALMEAAENWAIKKKAREIVILSNTILEPAIALYRKHGYEVTHLGKHPDYERCNIVMRKHL